jgi:beta-lactamase class A
MRPEPGLLTRRILVGGGLAAAPAGAWAAAPDAAERRLARIERETGGILGVMALDTGSGRRIAHKAEARLPLCSTFKWLLAAAILHRVDRGMERLKRRIAYSKADLLLNSPTTEAHLSEGSLTVGALCEAAITLSDNAAANLLLATVGGPAGLTRWLRAIGDPTTRLDHGETALNDPGPRDPRDRTSAAAMVGDLRRIVLGEMLTPASREQLIAWLVANKTGATRLRAGLPRDWRIGDKTGAWNGRTANDVAVAWPPGRAPILIAAYCSGGSASDEARNAALAEVGRTIAAAYGAAA